MKRLVSRTGIIVAGSAATMSVGWAAFGPHGFPWLSPWLSFAWASLASLAVFWVVQGSIRLNRRFDDVESALRIRAAPASDPARVSGGRQVGSAG